MKSGEAKLFAVILIVAVVLVAVVAVPILMTPQEPPIVRISENLDPKRLVPEGSHIVGDPNAPFTLVEFTDYECGGCRGAQADVAKIWRQHKDKLKVVHHSIQVTAGHTLAPLLIQAAEAAGEQGKWREMNAALFANQDRFKGVSTADAEKIIGSLAADLGIDLLKFQADLVGEKARVAVQRMADVARYAEVRSTPAFVFIAPTQKGVVQFRNMDALKDHLAKPETWNVATAGAS